ncbi:MAG TPA: TlpA family protein disulfide reductase [Gammaproteobacteria bacterium]|nr:TlpA family protein disulfide reductase [Gammaproteobacteria bacterium]
MRQPGIRQRLMALLLYLLAGSTAAAGTPPGIRTLEPRPAPDFTLTDMDGNRFSLSTARGRWVMVHFWASWCRPCRREMPAIRRMSELIGTDAPRLVLVNTAEDEDTVFSFLGAVAPDLSSLLDRDGRVTEAWQPRGLPATWLVDPQGYLRYQALGGRPWDQPRYLDFLRRLGD